MRKLWCFVKVESSYFGRDGNSIVPGGPDTEKESPVSPADVHAQVAVGTFGGEEQWFNGLRQEQTAHLPCAGLGLGQGECGQQLAYGRVRAADGEFHRDNFLSDNTIAEHERIVERRIEHQLW